MELNNQPVHNNLCRGTHGPLQKPAPFTDLHFQCPHLVGRWWLWTVPSVMEMAESCLFKALTKAAPLGVRASLDIAAEVYGHDLTHRQPSLPWPPRGGWRALCSHLFLKRSLKGTLAQALLHTCWASCLWREEKHLQKRCLSPYEIRITALKMLCISLH